MKVSAALLSILFLAAVPVKADIPSELPVVTWEEVTPELTRVTNTVISGVVNGFRTSGDKALNPAETMAFVEGYLTVALEEYQLRRFDSYTLAFEDLRKSLLDSTKAVMDRSKEGKKEIGRKLEGMHGSCFAVIIQVMRHVPLHIELHYPELLTQPNPQLKLKQVMLASLNQSGMVTTFAVNSTDGIRQADIKREQRLRRRERVLAQREERMIDWENRVMEREGSLSHQERLIQKENDLIRRERSLQHREAKLEKKPLGKKKATKKG